jgi:hypothetical protein
MTPVRRSLLTAAVVGTIFVVTPTSSASGQVESCAGDCDGDGVVRVNELVRLVDAALDFPCVIPEPELCPLDPCFLTDADEDGEISAVELVSGISRIIDAVGNALSACP